MAEELKESHLADGAQPNNQVQENFQPIRGGGMAVHVAIDAHGANVSGQITPTIHVHNYPQGLVPSKDKDDPPSAIPVLDRLQKSLREKYKDYTRLERLFDESDTPIAKSFINLALIKEAEQKTKEKGLSRGGAEEKNDGGEDGGREQGKSLAYVDERLASHEQLYAVKEPLALTELFDSKDGTPAPNKLLILGRAGIGKSILCQYLATQWASEGGVGAEGDLDANESKHEQPVADYLQQKFEAVFWLKLREVAAKMTDRETLVDVLDRLCLESSKENRPTKKELVRYLKEATDKILFILDGYDEITDRIEQPEYQHLNRLLEELTTHQHLLLTSRPITIDTLGGKRIQFDRRLENMGFLNENIEAYIHQFMEGAYKPEQAALMLSFLRSHPGVWGIAHIPINLELLSWLWSKGELTFEQGQVITLSKLYQIIVERVQEAYVHKALKQPAALDLDDQMESKAEGTVADSVNAFLECLAFSAMEKETLFIPAANLRAALKKTLTQHHQNKVYQAQLLKAATDKLGFLRTTGQGGRSQLDQEHYFIHLSFQEFYAARYIARILSEQPLNSPESQYILQCIRVEKYTPRYQLMLWMSAGLLYQRGKSTRQFAPVERFWQATLSPPRDLIGYHHRDLVMHCLDECEADSQLPVYRAFLRQHPVWLKSDARDVYVDQLVRCPVFLGSKPMVDTLLKQAKEKDWKVRCAAVKVIGNLKDPSNHVIAALLEALKDEESYVRHAVVKALGKLNNLSREVITVLLEAAMKDKGWDVRQTAARALGNPSHSSVDAMTALLLAAKDENANVREAAADALGQLKNPSLKVLTALLEMVQDKNRSVRHPAVKALGELQHPSGDAIAALLDAVKDEYGDVRCAAANALGRLNNPSSDVIAALLEALKDANSDVRRIAADALGQLSYSSVDAMTALLGAVKDEDKYVRRAAVSALGKLNNPSNDVIVALLGAVKDEDGDVKSAAVYVLGKLKNPSREVIGVLLGAVQDGNPYVRIAAVSALGKLGYLSEDAVPMLLELLKDEDADVRTAAVYMLGQLKSPSNDVIAVLLVAVKDKDVLVRRAAVEALGQLNNPGLQVIATLLEALKDEDAHLNAVCALFQLNNPSRDAIAALLVVVKDKDRHVRRGAVGALGQLKDPNLEVITALLGAAKDEDRDVRAAAGGALVKLSSQWHCLEIILENLTSASTCATYFEGFFQQDCLLCIDHSQNQLIICPERQTYCIPLPKKRLEYLEKQITAVAKERKHPMSFDIPSDYGSLWGGWFSRSGADTTQIPVQQPGVDGGKEGCLVM